MIYELHGSVNNLVPSVINRRLLSRDKLLDWAERKQPFTNIEYAMSGNGNAITIDDATHCAYETALALKNNGHEVTIFVNMFNVIYNQDYFFHKLNAVLEEFYNLKGIVDIPLQEKIRQQFKDSIMIFSNTTDIETRLKTFCQNENMDYANIIDKISDPVRVIDIAKCQHLVQQGIQLGNHFYNHLNPTLMDNNEYIRNLNLNEHLLKKHFDVESLNCAIPFGKFKGLKMNIKSFEKYYWMLSDKIMEPGPISQNIYNRFSLDNDCDLLN